MNTTSNESDKVQPVRRVSSLAEFIEWVDEIGEKNMLFRGLANAEWGGESSLYRRLILNGLEDIYINSDIFLEMTKRLINHARREGHDINIKNGQKLNDLELLADLQHYGAATCLIDFTKHSLIALCFACETAYKKDGKEKADGKVIAFNSDKDDSYNEIPIEDLNEKIEHWFQNENLWILSPKKLNNRITSQQSVFVFGGSTLSTKNFHICEIDTTKKERILDELKKNGISAGMMFDDFVGFSALNSHNKKYENWDTDSDFVSGRICNALKKFETAIQYYDKAIKSNSKDWGSYNNRGNAKKNLGNFQDAISDFDDAIKLNPKYSVAYNNRGGAKHRLGNFDDAISDYNETIRLNPKDSIAYINRGMSKNKLGDSQNAISDFDDAIQLNPKHWAAYNNRGISKTQLGNFQDAISDFDNAIKLNPKYWEAYNNRGIVKNKLGHEKSATVDFAKAKELNPEFKIPDLPPDKSDK